MKMWGLTKLAAPFGPQNKEYSILGSILGAPYFGKRPDVEMEKAMEPTTFCSLLKSGYYRDPVSESLWACNHN